MAKNDEWCELCDEKLKSTSVKYGSRELGVCEHCASLYIEPETK